MSQFIYVKIMHAMSVKLYRSQQYWSRKHVWITLCLPDEIFLHLSYVFIIKKNSWCQNFNNIYERISNCYTCLASVICTWQTFWCNRTSHEWVSGHIVGGWTHDWLIERCARFVKSHGFCCVMPGFKHCQRLNLQTIVTARLNPLRMCLPIIAKTFASITRYVESRVGNRVLSQ